MLAACADNPRVHVSDLDPLVSYYGRRKALSPELLHMARMPSGGRTPPNGNELEQLHQAIARGSSAGHSGLAIAWSCAGSLEFREHLRNGTAPRGP